MAMHPNPSWPAGHATPPPPPPPSFAAVLPSMASLPSHHDAYPSGYYSDVSDHPDTGYHNIPPPDFHQYRSHQAFNPSTSIGPANNLNPNSNMLNYPPGSSGFDPSQYAFTPPPIDSVQHTPSASSEGTGYSTTPPSGSLTSHQVVPNTCRSKDPALQQLADAIVNRTVSLGHEPLPDLYVAPFFSIKTVSGFTQPPTNRRKRRAKPRPKKMLAYHCLWCGRWDGYSKEKARQHFLVDLNMKRITCREPGCSWKTARPSDFTRHMKLVHKKYQPKKKSGGAMRAGRTFLELQVAYRNGERAFPVDANRNLSHFPATSNGLTLAAHHTQPATAQIEWIGSVSQFSGLNLTSTELDQVCLLPHTRYNHWLRCIRHIWVTTVSAVLVTAYAVVYSVCVRKPAEHLDSIAPKSTSDAKSKQIESFPWSAFISSVSGATIMTVPAQIQNNEKPKNISKCLTTSIQKISYCSDHFTPVNLRRCSIGAQTSRTPSKCHPNTDPPAMFPYAFSSPYACKYIPLPTATIGNHRVAFRNNSVPPLRRQRILNLTTAAL